MQEAGSLSANVLFLAPGAPMVRVLLVPRRLLLLLAALLLLVLDDPVEVRKHVLVRRLQADVLLDFHLPGGQTISLAHRVELRATAVVVGK